VTVVEKGPQIISREDFDVSEAVRSILEDEGVRIRTNSECIRFASHDGLVAVHVDCTEGAPEEFGSHLLLAMGRKPNTDDLGLDAAGVANDRCGIIPVDDQLATSVPTSGRSASVTAAAHSPTPRSTTTRSSPRTCSMAATAG